MNSNDDSRGKEPESMNDITDSDYRHTLHSKFTVERERDELQRQLDTFHDYLNSHLSRFVRDIHSDYELVDAVEFKLNQLAAEREAREKAELALGQEKKWKIEDPRMLREQLRVADVAFQSLHERHEVLLTEVERLRVDTVVAEAKLSLAMSGLTRMLNGMFDLTDCQEVARDTLSQLHSVDRHL